MPGFLEQPSALMLQGIRKRKGSCDSHSTIGGRWLASSVHSLRLAGELDIFRYEEVLAALTAVPEEASRIVVDLTDVTYIESTILEALLLARFKWRRAGHSVATIVVDDRVRKLIAIGNVLGTLNVFPTLDEALRNLGASCSA